MKLHHKFIESGRRLSPRGLKDDGGVILEPQVESGSLRPRMVQVLLHNDDVNTMEHVVACLREVFGHSETLAVKIMLEAHARGRAIAEIEAEPEARRHQAALHARHLIATVEPF